MLDTFVLTKQTLVQLKLPHISSLLTENLIIWPMKCKIRKISILGKSIP